MDGDEKENAKRKEEEESDVLMLWCCDGLMVGWSLIFCLRVRNVLFTSHPLSSSSLLLNTFSSRREVVFRVYPKITQTHPFSAPEQWCFLRRALFPIFPSSSIRHHTLLFHRLQHLPHPHPFTPYSAFVCWFCPLLGKYCVSFAFICGIKDVSTISWLFLLQSLTLSSNGDMRLGLLFIFSIPFPAPTSPFLSSRMHITDITLWCLCLPFTPENDRPGNTRGESES